MTRSLPDGSTPRDATWQAARRRAASDATALTRDGVAVVVAEGSFNLPSHRHAFAEALETVPLYVALQVSFDEALRRAREDPTRGRSRDAGFLSDYFASRRAIFAAAPLAGVVIDTERMTAMSAAARIVRGLERA